MSRFSEKEQLIIYGRLLYENRFVAGADGNLSVRLPDNNILMTPSGMRKGFLEEEDLVTVGPDGTKISGRWKPSSEMLMHLFVYRSRPEIFACCHAHPPFATAFSVIGRQMPANLLPEIVLAVGDIPLTEYAPPGTKAVPEAIRPFIGNNQAFLLRNHGVLTIGRNMEEAYNRMEYVEHYARILYISEKAGSSNFLDPEEMRRLAKIRDSFGQDNDK
jgi:L-fuculose-phosphate aldolase